MSLSKYPYISTSHVRILSIQNESFWISQEIDRCLFQNIHIFQLSHVRILSIHIESFWIRCTTVCFWNCPICLEIVCGYTALLRYYYKSMHVCMFDSMYVCSSMHVCMFDSMYAWMYACMYVCSYSHACMYVRAINYLKFEYLTAIDCLKFEYWTAIDYLKFEISNLNNSKIERQ
jgi:hypothetical protein